MNYDTVQVGMCSLQNVQTVILVNSYCSDKQVQLPPSSTFGITNNHDLRISTDMAVEKFLYA